MTKGHQHTTARESIYESRTFIIIFYNNGDLLRYIIQINIIIIIIILDNRVKCASREGMQLSNMVCSTEME
jgi:hypothetical protein